MNLKEALEKFDSGDMSLDEFLKIVRRYA